YTRHLHSCPTRRSSDLPLGQAKVVDMRTEHSEHPEAASLFLSNDCAQGQAVVGRISRLWMRPVPASDLEVEWTRYNRLKNLFARSEEHTSELQSRGHLV